MFPIIPLIVLLALFAAACTGLYRALRARPRKKVQALCAILFIGLFICLVMEDVATTEVDLNPLVRGNGPLLGSWKGEGASLELHRDGHYICAGNPCAAIRSGGQWQRFEDFHIDFVPATARRVRWRITENGGRYELIAGADGDINQWRTKVMFRSDNPAAVTR